MVGNLNERIHQSREPALPNSWLFLQNIESNLSLRTRWRRYSQSRSAYAVVFLHVASRSRSITHTEHAAAVGHQSWLVSWCRRRPTVASTLTVLMRACVRVTAPSCGKCLADLRAKNAMQVKLIESFRRLKPINCETGGVFLRRAGIQSVSNDPC
jgi:hypothetical protein